MEQKDLQQLLSEMSLEEKVGQMVQIPANVLTDGGLITGPTESIEMTEETTYLVGSILGKVGAEELHKIQKDFMEKHPHHIPLMLMYDVINGMETIFPIPLAQGCTFSPELVEAAARVAAKEATATGLHVTFSPMLDLVRDARWGRVMESPGEDPWLNSQMGKAMVRGYQGSSKLAGDILDLRKESNIAGCIKHFAGYGAPEGGRDYDNVELSERTFREDYLAAYKGAVEEGCVMVMTSFNTWNRIPSSGNRWLMRKVLREEMGFDGVLISDYSAIDEMIHHGIAEDSREAAKLAIMAGVDIDMVSNAYVKYLAELVRTGEVEERLIDEAVMRILKLKNDLGLFENPYKDGSAEKEKELFVCEEHRKLARKVAAASFVLLKNDVVMPAVEEAAVDSGADGKENVVSEETGNMEKILPLCKNTSEKLAFIGPYTDNIEMYGSWSFPAKPENTITIKQGVEQKLSEAASQGTDAQNAASHEAYSQNAVPQEGNVQNAACKKQDVIFARGCYMLEEGHCARFGKKQEYSEAEAAQMLAEALEAARQADKVVLCLGEHHDQTGEGGSRACIRIPENQMQLLRAVQQVNPNIITVLFAGRPLEIKELSELSKAVLLVWMPGTEGGNAIADVLFGEAAPEGRLSMTLPRSVGQVPIYYNKFMTGRPNLKGDAVGFIHGYIDESTKPLYPFGYGLSYTDFEYSEVELSKEELTKENSVSDESNKKDIIDTITAKVTVTNTGACAATETVQLYLRDVKGSVIRPIKMLRGVQKVTLLPGESREVAFEINEEMLRFYDINMDYVSEPGLFHVFIGHDSDTENMAGFRLV